MFEFAIWPFNLVDIQAEHVFCCLGRRDRLEECDGRSEAMHGRWLQKMGG